MSKFVVQPDRSRWWRLATSVLLLIMLLPLLLSGDQRRYLASWLGGDLDYELIWSANRDLKRENRSLREKVLRLEQTVSIDKQTATGAQAEIKELQEEIHHLKGRLQFYHDIMDAASATKGLNAGIYIEALGRQPGGYRLKLVLSHIGGEGNAVIRGVADVSLEGEQADGEAQIVNLRDISLNKKLDLSYRFRHFQRFESNFLLPDDFEPQRVSVNLLRRNKRDLKLNRVFEWSELAKER